jgi:hypothetical protein
MIPAEKPFVVPNVIYPPNSNMAVGDGVSFWTADPVIKNILINGNYLQLNCNLIQLD